MGHAMFDIINTHINKKVDNLIINGPKIGPKTGSEYLKMLSDEIYNHEKPDVLVIILKRFTSDKVSSLSRVRVRSRKVRHRIKDHNHLLLLQLRGREACKYLA